MPSLRGALAGAALLGTAAGAAYTLFAIARMRAFRRAAALAVPAHDTPAMTILKPLHGDEPHLYENLRSLCAQEYPQFQVVVCSADAADPGLAHARRLLQEFPNADICIEAGRARDVRNPKVGNLLGGMGAAKYEILVIADSDIEVDPGYLQAIAAAFSDPNVGAMTCLYGGAAADGNLASRLGAMYVNDHFAPSVLVAQAIEPLTYCFGATMAVSKNVLAKIGGLEALADHLGDDYRLGRLVHEAGYRIALSPHPVRTSVHERGLEALAEHELRWARTVRAQRPAGYAGAAVTHPLAWATAFALLSGSAAAGAAAIGTIAGLRMLLHIEAQKTFDPQHPPTPLLVPVRDALTFGVWCAGLSGRRIAWREHEYAINADGRLLGRTRECNDSALAGGEGPTPNASCASERR